MAQLISANERLEDGRPGHDDAWLDVRLASERWFADPGEGNRENLEAAIRSARAASVRMIEASRDGLAAIGDVAGADVRRTMEGAHAALISNVERADLMLQTVARPGADPSSNSGSM